jgi:hypothetical protein
VPTRRALLAATLSLAGCLDLGGAGDATTATAADAPSETTASRPETATVTPTATAVSTETPTAGAGALLLREANVTAVDVADAGGDVRFDVTLYHDDDGESGYADWWQVESLDGDRLGRRELLHAHGTRRFTRSATVAVPDAVRCVVVRGHDQTHGYGGQAALVRPGDGASRFVRQGPDPRSFGAGDCP